MKILRKAKTAQQKVSDALLLGSIILMGTMQQAMAQGTTSTAKTLDLTQDPTGGKNLDGLFIGGGATLFGQITYWLFQVLAPFVGGWLIFKGFMKLTKDNPHDKDGWWKDILIGFLLVGFTFLVFRFRNTIMSW